MKLYDDNVLSEQELLIALPSVIIGITLFVLPSEIASTTEFSDGWIAILIAGLTFMTLAWLSGKVAAAFPKQLFFTYSSTLVTRPVAAIFVFCIGVVAIFMMAYIVRSLAFISQEYLFRQTPMEILALSFLLVVIYAVSGSRAGIFRLNILFLPIILVVYLLVILFNIRFFEMSHFYPLFKTDIQGYGKAMLHSLTSFSGFGILLYYLAFVNKPKNITKIAFIGVGIPTFFYILVFITSIGVFGNTVTSNLNFPTIEIAKQVDVPGSFLERVDTIVFTILIMSIFNSAAIIYDVAILQFRSLFKVKKFNLILVLAPIIFYIAMFPQTLDQVRLFTNWIGYISAGLSSFIIILLFTIAVFKGVLRHDKTEN